MQAQMSQVTAIRLDDDGPFQHHRSNDSGLQTVWFELTGKCQLNCGHCYAESGPKGTHGIMTTADWLRLVDEAKSLDVRLIQLIGGEPTLHPGWVDIAGYALKVGIRVEVYSNLVRIKSDWWDILRMPGMSLATSYYSPTPAEHNAITRRTSHNKTLRNIKRALELNVPLRVSVIGTHATQQVQEAMRQLKEIGVQAVGLDHLRQVGRGVRDLTPSTAQLCGECGKSRCAISPTGDVWPCVLARWGQTTMGSVRTASLGDILVSANAIAINYELQKVFEARKQEKFCTPDNDCGPVKDNDCGPDCCPNTIHCKPDRGE